jgi:N-acetylglucosaminyl-diphospho-decaprenol L-rhamnosyltransferase
VRPSSEPRPTPVPWPKLEFSVVSGANPELLLGCLDSLLRTLGPAWHDRAGITVTCNRPGSDLPSVLRSRYPNIRVVENLAPQAFAANHNAVLKSSGAEVVWVINDDLVFLPGTIDTVMAFLVTPGNERVAAVSPRLLNPDGSLQPSTYTFPTVPRMLLAYSGLREHRWVERSLPLVATLLGRGGGRSRFWPHDRTTDVDTLRGACVAVRMTAVRDAGLMTEVALVGGEETEWHRRFAAHGWRVVFLPASEVIHYGGQTVGRDQRFETEYLKSTLYYFRIWRSRPVYECFRLAAAALFGTRLVGALLRHDHFAAERLRASARACLAGVPS